MTTLLNYTKAPDRSRIVIMVSKHISETNSSTNTSPWITLPIWKCGRQRRNLRNNQNLPWNRTWKYFGPLDDSDHLFAGELVEAGEQVVGCVGLCVVISSEHNFRLYELQDATHGWGQKRCYRRDVGDESGGWAQLFLGGQKWRPFLWVLQGRILANAFHLSQLLRLPCWEIINVYY